VDEVKQVAKLFFTMAVILSAAFSGKTYAHGGVALEFDKCISQMGKYQMHFTAYMAGEGTEYCFDLPMAGKAIMVFDLWQPEMRTKPIEFRIVETADDGEPGANARTLVHLEPKTYPTGTINVEGSFETGKKYMAVVTISDTRPLVLKAPIRVGESGGGSSSMLLAVLGLAAAAGGFYFWKSKSA
jgi:hypothetical protein